MVYTSQNKSGYQHPLKLRPETVIVVGGLFGTKKEEIKNAEDKLIELWILTVIFYILKKKKI